MVEYKIYENISNILVENNNILIILKRLFFIFISRLNYKPWNMQDSNLYIKLVILAAFDLE